MLFLQCLYPSARGQSLTHSHFCQQNSLASVKPQVFCGFCIHLLLLLPLFQLRQSRQKNLHAKPAEYLITHAACDHVCPCSFCISKHGNDLIGNIITLQELRDLVQSPLAFTTFSAYTDGSRCGVYFGLYGLVRFSSLLNDRHGL